MKNCLTLFTIFVACVTLVNGIPFRSPYTTGSSKEHVDGYLKKLSSNYLHLLKSLLSQKYQHGASKRSTIEDEILDNDMDHFLGKEKKAASQSRSAIINGYIRRISSNYLRLIREYLEKHPGKTSTKRKVIENSNAR